MTIKNQFASISFATRLSEQVANGKSKSRSKSDEQPKAESIFNIKDD